MSEDFHDDGDIRLGRIAVAQGFLTPHELTRCLDDQAGTSAAGRPERLGEVMVRMGFLTHSQMKRLLE